MDQDCAPEAHADARAPPALPHAPRDPARCPGSVAVVLVLRSVLLAAAHDCPARQAAVGDGGRRGGRGGRRRWQAAQALASGPGPASKAKRSLSGLAAPLRSLPRTVLSVTRCLRMQELASCAHSRDGSACDRPGAGVVRGAAARTSRALRPALDQQEQLPPTTTSPSNLPDKQASRTSMGAFLSSSQPPPEDGFGCVLLCGDLPAVLVGAWCGPSSKTSPLTSSPSALLVRPGCSPSSSSRTPSRARSRGRGRPSTRSRRRAA